MEMVIMKQKQERMEENMLRKLNSPVLYLICGAIILFVAIVCVIALVRAWRAGIKIGMDKRKLKRAVTASITFSILPSAGIRWESLTSPAASEFPGRGCGYR